MVNTEFPMQGACVRSLVWELDPMCHTAAWPKTHTKLYCTLKVAERVGLKSSHHKKNNHSMCQWMLTRVTVVTISQYIQMQNNYVVQLKHMLHINYSSFKNIYIENAD